MRLIWDADGKKFATTDPTPELIEELIDELNNINHTMVALDMRGQSSLIVNGGDENGRVRVSFIPESLDAPSKHLIDTSANGDRTKLNMQGKYTVYEVQHTVTRSQATHALIAFTQHPAPCDDLEWIDDI